jgi:PAS domain S-box-containing protein
MTKTTAAAFGLDVLANILEASLDGIIIATAERRIVYANPALVSIIGRSCADIIGADFLELIAPQARAAMLENIANSLTGTVGLRATALVRPNGSERQLEYTSMVIPAPNPLLVAIVRDITDARRQEREAAALARIAANLTIDQPMETTLETLAEIVVTSTQAIGAAVMLISEDGAQLDLAGTWGLPPGTAEALVAAWPEARKDSATAEAFRTGQYQIFENAVARNLARPGFAPIHQLLREARWDTIVSMPLMYRGTALGVLTTYYQRDPGPADAEISFIKAMADQAAIAVQNARLYYEAQQKAALEERQRLARELHDSVSQALYGIGLGARAARTLLERDPARAAEPLDYVLSLTEAGLAEMRSLIFELRPETLETEGLVTALERQARSLHARHHIEVQATFCKEPAVPLQIKEAIYRIVQEALHNTVKHAHARHVDLRLDYDEREVEFSIGDDGTGFDPTRDFPGHLGLRSMRERVARLGGAVQIDSAPGAGTRITGRIPIRP